MNALSPVSPDLDWPNESAAGVLENTGNLTHPGSNILLDLHGDPLRARLAVFSDGNHHMALEETLQAFLAANSSAEDVFYATTPPRIIIDALASGRICCGNIVLSLHPHVFISPDNIMTRLSADGLVGPSIPFMRSDGLSILLAKDNPRNIVEPDDLFRDGVRLAVSNPATETASFSIYEAALIAIGARTGRDESDIRDYLRGDGVVKSRLIHHREIPQIVASGHADASLVYHHLALRYARIFPNEFQLLRVDLEELLKPEAYLTAYCAALVGDGGAYGSALMDFLGSSLVTSIYAKHGLRRPDN
ncbi:MAG: substrate-binding domain-containing protein [Alphaproteobacteria bacterium]|nr:substrate-binding domain-containing protein [Alphaproteobacteria bacterium]